MMTRATASLVLGLTCFAQPIACFAQDTNQQPLPRTAAASQAPRVFVATQGWVCAVNDQAELYCKLLSRGEGRPPSGIRSELPTFEKVAGLSDIVEVDAHGKYLCALDKRGGVRCWGCTSDRKCALWPAPITLSEPAQHIAVSVGGACALLRSGSVQCWGVDARPTSAPSTPSTPSAYEKPKPIALARDVTQVSALGQGYCALHGSGAISCWGSSTLPTRIGGITDASALATGLSFGCAIAGPQREVWCWGLSESALRQAKDNPASVEPAQDPVMRIAGLQQVVQLAAANLFAVAITQDGAAYHFGAYTQPGHRQFGQPGMQAVTEPAGEHKGEHKPLLIDIKPARLALKQRALRALVGNHFLCLELARGQRACERALARKKPFDMREVWPGVRFESVDLEE